MVYSGHGAAVSEINWLNMLQNVFSRAYPGLLGQLSQQLQAAAYYSVQIVVPALGDSISDGEQAMHSQQLVCCLFGWAADCSQSNTHAASLDLQWCFSL